MTNCNQPIDTLYPFEVRISEPLDKEGRMTGIYMALDWLADQGFKYQRDFVIDMYGGQRSYCSVWFKNKDNALMVKLTIGGA